MINDIIIFTYENSVANTYLHRCGENWVKEDDEIRFPVPEDAGRHDTPCSQMLVGITAGGITFYHRQAGTGSVLASFIFINKLCDLQLMIWGRF
jgi:hypothetical protein